ncbi:iron(III) dicitrate transport system [Geminocystis sp. NIES-3708]|uniref:iron-siderophore ABC transporter substrate-binding protein n=1 Tax=Geminocystis sp. NIES-3708 TaxID=1615909 RepID=UPI0005FC4964|nr:iron-siderophore ABC transporter substrate-binding protein [Geminocystis sp. NIES-3708]BAQ62133.1 iron(III) dicitrate transport system [Geminocystis sp. NIES-3708]
MGETCIPLNPQRIVTLDILSLGDTLALGVKPIASAIWSPTESLSEMPPYLRDKINGIVLHGFSTSQPNLETILQLKPDLIITPSDPSSKEQYQQLSHIAPTVLVPWAEISRDWKQHLKETAKVLDKTEIADRLLINYYQRVEKIKQMLQNKPTLASFIYVGNGGVYLTQKNSFSGTILNDLGLLSPKSSNDLALPISEESWSEIDSDVIFIGCYQKDDCSTLEAIKRKPLWSKVNAVKQNQVFPVDFQTWYGFDFLASDAVLDDIEKYLLDRK